MYHKSFYFYISIFTNIAHKYFEFENWKQGKQHRTFLVGCEISFIGKSSTSTISVLFSILVFLILFQWLLFLE